MVTIVGRTKDMSAHPTRSRLRRGALAVLAAAGVGLSAMTPAEALGRPPVRPGEGISWGDGGQAKITTIATGEGSACSFIASPNAIGGVCVHAKGFDGPTIEEILGGDPLPECWQEKLTAQELSDLNLANGTGTSWYWNRCLAGIDRETMEIEPGGLYFGVGILPFRDDDPELVFLTPNQQAFVERFVDRGNVPTPVLVASPNPTPFVNDDVAFFNYGEDELVVDMRSAPGVQMRAKITETKVYPEGPDGPVVTCAGPGVQAEEGDTPESLPEACWHAYEQSSIGRDGDVFDAEIHVKWQVDVRIGGVWRPFHEFTKASPAMVQVNEVQALVRP